MELYASKEELDAVQEYDNIPKGTYPAQLTDQEMKDTSKGGKQLVFHFQIIGDKCKGRKISSFFNVVCGSQKAEQIAREEILRCAKACGSVDLRNTEELNGKCCMLKVDTELTINGNQRNVIKGFSKLEGSYETIPTAASPVQSAPAKQWYEK